MVARSLVRVSLFVTFFVCLNALTGTVHYDSSSNTYTLVTGIDHEGVAYGEFVDEMHKDGWGKLNIQTNAQYGDEIQMFAAGYLEGAFTHERIYDHYVNVWSYLFKNISTPMPDVLHTWFKTQHSWVHDESLKNKASDPYWGQVAGILAQFDGLVAGYNAVASKKLESIAFTVLNGVGDLIDLTAAFTDELNLNRPKRYEDWDYESLKNWIYNTHCSSIIKVTGDLSDLYAGHTAWFMFSSMSRISKNYNFALNNPTTASPQVVFSSYPGFLESLDDFYITTQKLIVIETSNSIFNHTLYDYVKSNPYVILSWQRTLLSNRMAHTSKEWAEIYSKHNSGTYNNQWIVVDLKQFERYSELKPWTLMILEQIPTHIEYGDQTAHLENGYWPSYNVPFYDYIFKASGYAEMAKQQPVMLSYQTCCRANIFRRDNGKVDSLDGIKRILRYNDWQHDPYSQGNPGYSISSRFDLEPFNPAPFGGYDNKVTSYDLAMAMTFEAVNGPTSQEQAPFYWAEHDGLFANTSHVGLPPKFDFPYVTMKPKNF
eukprot:TRINITY_DN13445_c0_g1_i1.p1 TRINITY_DN13445_c0_g1~~TRINITY_DN13445_c0_g1_i1.p1  ORF type:complete len:542 (+),score=120.42 TRINITY_DN13445_c0_g1_i1:50-1675(+)